MEGAKISHSDLPRDSVIRANSNTESDDAAVFLSAPVILFVIIELQSCKFN